VPGDLDFVGATGLRRGRLDFVGGDLDFVGGDLDFVGGDLDFVGGDLDFVGGDVEPTFAAAAALGYASPNTFKACVIGAVGVDCLAPPPALPPPLSLHRMRSAWKVPVVGSDKVTLYTGYRAVGSTFNPGPVTTVQVGTPSLATNLVDNDELPDGVLNNIKFTYSVTATFSDLTVSGYSASRSATITPVNDAPVAVPDSYTMLWNGTLNVTGRGVLANDTDDDSPATSLRAVRVAGPSHGTLALTPGGSFTYTPAKNFVGTDTFSYRANDGVWSRDSTKVMSATDHGDRHDRREQEVIDAKISASRSTEQGEHLALLFLFLNQLDVTLKEPRDRHSDSRIVTRSRRNASIRWPANDRAMGAPSIVLTHGRTPPASKSSHDLRSLRFLR
jgi:hypothetical protein